MLTLLRKWFESEWGDVDPFEGIYPEIIIPRPIVAVGHQASLLGGLSFTSAPKPQSTDIGVWINMVLISPRQRKKGIASKLIEAAEVEAKRIAISELFVLSEFPNLYQRLGWQSVGLDSSGKETVLKIVLVDAQS
jgi:GNAT superfamily N-acetyltransferase